MMKALSGARPLKASPPQQGDWRRDNVNRLIQQLKLTIASTKPWVRFPD